MSIKHSIKDLYDKFAQEYFNISPELHEKSQRLICALYAKYPKGLVLNPLARVMMREYCALVNTPLPQKPEPPHKGGQCVGKTYKVAINYDRYSGDTFVQNSTEVFNGVPGKILGVRGTRTRSNPPVAGLLVVVDPEPVNKAIVERPVGGIYDRTPVIKSYSVQIEGGLVDDCGDLPADFPVDPPPDSNDFNTTIDIDNKPYDVVVPPPDCPVINVNFYVGGIPANIDSDGLTLGEHKPCPIEKEKEEEEEVKAVLIDVTKLPEGGKTMLMEKEEDMVVFAGYFRWIYKDESGDYGFQEEPIRKKKTAFIRPIDASDFAYYAINKAELKATVIMGKKQETN